jgi:hypothetical protein
MVMPMLTAKHSKIKNGIFALYLNRLLKKRFASLNLLGDIPVLSSEWPLILYANHNTWWDGFFVFILNKLFLQRKMYIMMLEKQLAIYSFFRGIGAFGIRKGSPGDIKKSLQYCRQILSEPNTLLCMFPQGELLEWNRRPVVFEKGLLHIIEQAPKPVHLLPLAMRPEFLEEERARVFFRFGALQSIKENSPLVSIEQYALELETLMVQIEKEIAAGGRGKIIFRGKRSVSKVIEELKK